MPAPAGPLLDQLRRDATAAIAARAAEARAEAARIRDAAAARRARRRADAVADRERGLSRLRAAARDEATQQTRRAVLDARADYLERVFAEVARQLEMLGGRPDLAQRLTPLLADALPFIETAETRVRCSRAAGPAVEAALAALGCAGAPVAIDDTVPLGAILEDARATVRVDATLAARLHRLRPTLSIDAVRMLEEAAP